MRTIESLQKNECIEVRTSKEARAIGDIIYTPQSNFVFPFYLNRKNDGAYYYSDVYFSSKTIIPASEFMQPSVEDRLEALEKAFADYIGKQTPLNNIAVDKPKEIDFSKAGQLVTKNNGVYVVMTTGGHSPTSFEGTILNDPFNNGNLGEVQTFLKSLHTLLDKPITISN